MREESNSGHAMLAVEATRKLRTTWITLQTYLLSMCLASARRRALLGRQAAPVPAPATAPNTERDARVGSLGRRPRAMGDGAMSEAMGGDGATQGNPGKPLRRRAR